MRLIVYVALSVLITLANAAAEVVEEFSLRGPTEFYDMAMHAYIELRKDNPAENLDDDSTLMKKAKNYAVKRLLIKDESDLKLAATISQGGLVDNALDGPRVGFLPAPGGQDSFLTAAVSTHGSSGPLMVLPETLNAMALQFHEDVSFGAISRAGAIANSNWTTYAEEKLKRENSLDHQSLMWEIGSEVTERQAVEQGNINTTQEVELMERMKEWFTSGGGKLNFVELKITHENGSQLIATEHIDAEEAVVSVPMKLIMSRQTARNVLIPRKGRYLGEELSKTFDKNEVWGLALFLLHEYYKEVAGAGSKWGPFIRTLRMRLLTTPVMQGLKGTATVELANQWIKGAESFMWWSSGTDGPCTPTTGVCNAKPHEKFGESRFTVHQIRWAFWVVKQNAVRMTHRATGLQFLALVPFHNMFCNHVGVGGGAVFELDGTITIRAGESTDIGSAVFISPGDISDPEFFLRYLDASPGSNPNNYIKLALPGALPKGSKFHYCMKGTKKEQSSDVCKGSFRSDSMFWKSKVLGEWRKTMNLPPRLQELRMMATRLHLYGTDEEMRLMTAANYLIAGLPIPVDQMPAEEQLMLMGVAKDSNDAALMVMGPEDARPPPQLYSAPDPDEDPEAKRAMEQLAMLAVQAQTAIFTGNVMLNATQAVLNHTRDFFQHGILPMAGLDELDEFLLKKIGMLSHCGFENDMKITLNNVTDQLMCAMRVHLMNESDIHTFCPREVKPWDENCHSVEFANFTAISPENEQNLINALRSSILSLLNSFPNSAQDDRRILRDHEAGSSDISLGPVMISVVRIRLREKELLLSALDFLEAHEAAIKNGTVTFQLEEKLREREVADKRAEEHKLFITQIQSRAMLQQPLATVAVNMGVKDPSTGLEKKHNLTLEEGESIETVVNRFCVQHSVPLENVAALEKALRAKVTSPAPLSLFLPVISPSTGDRRILAVPDGSNATVETHIFCIKNNITDTVVCEAILNRVRSRMETMAFQRRILAVVPIDAPDSRKLKLIVREGEQHDLMQYASDFLELYKMPLGYVETVANEVHKRLPAIALQIPVSIAGKRQVAARFSANDNITAVVEGFTNFFEIDDLTKVAILKRARSGMAPGTFLI